MVSSDMVWATFTESLLICPPFHFLVTISNWPDFSQCEIAVCFWIRGTQRGEFLSSVRCLGTQPRARSRKALHSHVWWLMLALAETSALLLGGFSTSARSFTLFLPQSAGQFREHTSQRDAVLHTVYRWNCIW